ncbi:MAG: DUF424 family protein [Candidatus Micrarchaeota archaeon]|nr:DUF424 family protein [Candidatus Micrarchaeota archaeon]
MYLKIHENANGKVIAICDRELIGKVLEEGDKYLDLETHKRFYVGEQTDENGVRKILGDFQSANLVGTKAVGVALELGMINEEDVMYIKETPYIQIYKI